MEFGEYTPAAWTFVSWGQGFVVGAMVVLLDWITDDHVEQNDDDRDL